jgi:uncharacterized protein YndB with AHSA1/START domain
MPAQKDLKRIVRSRMEKTGESYTAARRHIVHRPQVDYSALAGMSDATIQQKTGRSWAQWAELLDAFGEREKSHTETAAYVHEQGVGDWWAQSVTVGYERIRGLRAIGQRRSGAWEASKSKTVAVPVDRLFDAFANARTRKRWLGDVKLTIRKATKPKSMRVTWDDGSSIEIGFYPKGDAKSSVAVQHTKLASKEDADAKKTFWSEKLEALAAMLTK